MADRAIACWEALDPGDPVLSRVRRLYESTLDAAERIPWAWIEGAVAQRPAWRPGHWSPHLVLAALRTRGGAVGRVSGFAYGAHVPGYGGYACYLGVEESARGRGLGTRLMQLLQRLFAVDAFAEGADLPFVVWESRRPEPTAPPAERALWQTRLRLFARLGAWWVAGLNFLAPDFSHRGAPPVPLQLFLIPLAASAASFDADALRRVAAGLLAGVYGRSKGDPLMEQTLRPACRPTLRPVAEADAGVS